MLLSVVFSFVFVLPNLVDGFSTALPKNSILFLPQSRAPWTMSSVPRNMASIHARHDESHQQKTITSQLSSYAWNIKRSASKDQREALRPVRSLIFFLEDNSLLNEITLDRTSLGDALNSALISGIRTASLKKDYRVILSLLQSAVTFSAQESILAPRVFGEAFECLSRTSANVSKLKQTWQLAIDTNLKEPLGAFELNAMLGALGKRGKIHASLQLFRSCGIEGDAFTASILLNILTSSIDDNQAVPDDWTSDKSPCWQYEEGMQLIREFNPAKLNNHVFSAALKLNNRASEVFPKMHPAAKAALALFGFMKAHKISPDVVTCTQIISTFDKHHEWRAAVSLLESMVSQNSANWVLPKPNEYAYSAAISACARCGEYNEALELFDNMREHSKPNTWVYNAVLSACVSPVQKTRNNRIRMAYSLLERMHHDHAEHGLDTLPDTVSYNTALAVMDVVGAILRDKKGKIVCEFSDAEEEMWVPEESLVTRLLEEMKLKGVARDALTYHNAVKASKMMSPAIFRFLQEAISDLKGAQESELTGRAGQGLIFVFNTALSTLASRGDMDLMSRVLAMMKSECLEPDSESIIQLVFALGRSHNSRSVTALLHALRGNIKANELLQLRFGIDLSIVMKGHSKELERLYAVSITSCLYANDVDSAMGVLSLMKENKISPSILSIEEIGFAYTKLAVNTASKEAIVRRKLQRANKVVSKDVVLASKSHAQRALTILNGLESPSPTLMSAVSIALVISGQHDAGRQIMGRIHTIAKKQKLCERQLLKSGNSSAMEVLPNLHRSVLKICAGDGNVTAALNFVQDIQTLSNELYKSSKETCVVDVPLVPNITDPAFSTQIDPIPFTRKPPTKRIRMRGEDWKLFLITASKQGDWRLCINTLQFLRPFVKATNPRKQNSNNGSFLAEKYRRLARSLTAAILCFEMRGQYGWAVRAMDDWMKWSSRRPPKEAVLATIRILVSHGQGADVLSLVQHVLSIPPSLSNKGENTKLTYEEIIYFGGITHLHQNGLYEDADELYLIAIGDGKLPFNAVSKVAGRYTLDLHGMNIAVAQCAVRLAFTQDMLSSTDEGGSSDLIIVTGRGLNSYYQMRPVIRPEIQRMLTEEFYPPLTTASVPGNLGALKVPAEDIEAWVTHQKREKGVRMLALADVIKNLSGKRLPVSIMKSVKGGSVGETEDGDPQTTTSSV